MQSIEHEDKQNPKISAHIGKSFPLGYFNGVYMTIQKMNKTAVTNGAVYFQKINQTFVILNPSIS